MGLIAEIEEIKKHWRDGSTTTKVLICFSTFMTFSSLASLSDTIVKWKGFILDGINFYRTWVSLPLINIIQSFGLNFNQSSLDFMVILFLQFFAIARVNYCRDGKKGFWVTVLFSSLFYFSFTIIFLYFFGRIYSYHLLPVFFVLVLYPQGSGYSKKDKIAYYTPVVLSVTAILFLSAINKGLSL